MEVENVILNTEENLDHILDRHTGAEIKTFSKSFHFDPSTQEVQRRGDRILEDKEVYCNCGEDFTNVHELQDHIQDCYNPNDLIAEWFEGEVGIHGFELTQDINTGNLRWSYAEGDLGIHVYATIDYNGVREENRPESHYIHFQCMTNSGVEIKVDLQSMEKPFTPRTYFKMVRDFIEDTLQPSH